MTLDAGGVSRVQARDTGDNILSETTTPPVSGDDAELRDQVTEQTETGAEPDGNEDAAEQHFERRTRHNDLLKRMHQVRLKAKAAEERAAQAERERDEARRLAAELAAQRATAAASLATSEIEAAEQAVLRAQMEGDGPALVKAQKQLTLATLAEQRAREEQQRAEAQSKAPAQPQPQQQRPLGSPAVEAWLEENPWFHTDRRMHAHAMAAHEDAIEAGLKLESPKYFAFIDKAMRERFADRFADDDDDGAEGAETEAAPPPARTQQPAARPVVAAAPRRNTVATAPAPSRGIRLTAEQREHARAAGVSEQEYAASLQRLQKSGKI